MVLFKNLRWVIAAIVMGFWLSTAVADDFWSATPDDLAANLAKAEQADKKGLFVFYEMEDCPFCDQIKQEVFPDATVREFIHEHFTAVMVDIESDQQLHDLTGTVTTEQAFAESQRVRATPVMIFYDVDGDEITRYVGPVRNADAFLELGTFVTSGAATQPGMNFQRYQEQNR